VNRASPAPASRAAQRLISNKGPCNCGQSTALQRQLFEAKSYVVAIIVRLAELAESPTDSIGLALTDARKALSALENP
jgi:hypothetical protein